MRKGDVIKEFHQRLNHDIHPQDVLIDKDHLALSNIQEKLIGGDGHKELLPLYNRQRFGKRLATDY